MRILLLFLIFTNFFLIYGQSIVTIYPVSSSMNTGYVTSAGTKNSGDMQVSTGANYGRGWAKFPLIAIPQLSTITGVTIKFYTYGGTSSTTTNTISGFTGDPVTMTGSTLYSTIGSGTVFNSSTWTIGNINAPSLNTKILSAASFVQQELSTGYVNFGFVRGAVNLHSIYGFSNTDYKICIEVTYTSNCISTLTSNLTPNVNLMNTGYVTSAGSLNDGDMQVSTSTSYGRGWAKFSLTSIPLTATITGVTIKFYTFGGTSSVTTNTIRGFTGDPVTMTGSTLYSAIGTGTVFNTSTWTIGTINSPSLNTKILSAESFVQQQLSTGYVNFGFVRGSTSLHSIYGKNNSNYTIRLEITYTVPFTASISSSGTTTICQGASVNLNANTGNGLTYQWKKNGVNILGATSSTYSATTTGSYTVVMSNGIGCTDTSTPINVTVNNTPNNTITSNGSTNICQGSFIELIANTGIGLTYQWKKNGVNISGATSSSYSATTTGSYTVLITNSNGCFSTSSVIPVSVNQIPVGTIATIEPSIICNGDSVLINSNTNNSNYGYEWFLNEIIIIGQTNSILYAKSTGFYKILLNNNGCKAFSTNTVEITVNPIPMLSILGDTVLCLGESTELIASSDGNITWNGNLNQNSLVVQPTETNQYLVQAVNEFNCISNKQVTVEVNYPSDTVIYTSSYGPFLLNGIVYDESGIYTQDLETIKGCDSTVTIHLNYITNSIEELSDVGINIYPNPSNDGIFYLKDENSMIQSNLGIYNSIGQFLLEQIDSNTINLSSLSDGVYWIRFIVNEQLFFVRVVKG